MSAVAITEPDEKQIESFPYLALPVDLCVLCLSFISTPECSRNSCVSRIFCDLVYKRFYQIQSFKWGPKQRGFVWNQAKRFCGNSVKYVLKHCSRRLKAIDIHLVESKDPLRAELFKDIVVKFPDIKTVFLWNDSDITSCVLSVARNLTNLRCLRLHQPRLSHDLSARDLLQLAKRCPSLTSLCLDQVKVSAKVLGVVISMCSKLRALSLSRVEEPVLVFSYLTQPLHNLKYLYVRVSKKHSGYQVMARMTPNLVALDLHLCSRSYRGQLSPFMGHKLRRLCFSMKRTHFTPAHPVVAQLSNPKHFAALKYLNLRCHVHSHHQGHCAISANCWEYLKHVRPDVRVTSMQK